VTGANSVQDLAGNIQQLRDPDRRPAKRGKNILAQKLARVHRRKAAGDLSIRHQW
jgi:hypothetical protein